MGTACHKPAVAVRKCIRRTKMELRKAEPLVTKTDTAIPRDYMWESQAAGGRTGTGRV